MEKSEELSIRFREVMLNGKWIANTNYKELLTNVSWKESIVKIGSLNAISVLAQHINYYIFGVLNVFQEGTLDIKDKYSFDFPSIDNANDWDQFLNRLFDNSVQLAIAIEEMTTEQLDGEFVEKKYGSYRRNIEAMIEHCYYHLGQLSLIKKMVKEKGGFNKY